MEMCYSGTIVMPSSYAVMDEEEMTYIKGGWNYKYSKNNIAVPIKAMYVSKSVCLAFAFSVINAHKKHWYSITVNGMGAVRIASELYSHALAYYATSALKKIGIKNSVINEMRSHAKVADIGLGDGMDATYAIIWGLL